MATTVGKEAVARGKRLARKYLGIDKPHKHQKQTWRAVANERSVFLVAPTGSGKSLSFLVPCLAQPGLALVISPLLALMREQVERLKAAGIKAERIGHDMSKKDIRAVLRRIAAGTLKIVYLSPERIRNPDFDSAIRQNGNVQLIVCDECHCLSIWSRDFRPLYKDVSLLRTTFPAAPVICCTATADDDVESDVSEILKIYDFKRIVSPPHRPNLTFETVSESPVEYIPRAFQDAKRLARTTSGTAIVYCGSRRNTEIVCRQLMAVTDLSVAYYHAGMSAWRRQRVQDQFQVGHVDIVVATNAFGMGIDKPDVRLVFHYDIPDGVFAYCQEAGRAGRDGLPALCVLNYSTKGMQIRRFLHQIQNPKFYVYERLWKVFKKHALGKPVPFSTSVLNAIPNSSLGGVGVSALRYMEFKGCVKTSPGPREYSLNVLKPGLVRSILDRHRIPYRMSKQTVSFRLQADDPDDAPNELARKRAVLPSAPDEKIIVQRASQRLRVREIDVEVKKEKSENRIEELLAFADADDKQEFLNGAFLR